MNKFLNILDQKQEIEIDENKLKYMTFKLAIWDYFGDIKFSIFLVIYGRKVKYAQKIPC